MASTRLQEIRVGVVTLVAAVVLVAGIIWGKGTGLGVDNRVVTMLFPNAAGVDVGAPITLRGVRKGAVTSLEVRPDGVRISALVESSFPLKRDAKAQIQMLEVTGGKKIELIPGESAEPLASGAVIPGEVQGDITSMLADVGDITASTKIVVRRVDSTLVMVNEVLGSRTFRRNIENTLANLESTSAAAQDLIAGNRVAIQRMISNFDGLSGDLRDLVARTRPAVDRAMTAVDTLSTDARVALRHLDMVLQHSDTLIARVDDIARRMQQGEGAVAKLLNDKGFAEELEGTLKSVRRLVENFDQGKTRIPLKIGF
jgi:phospholipid/cholesterol/gamma-HCH transport system substrate-binding protein